MIRISMTAPGDDTRIDVTSGETVVKRHSALAWAILVAVLLLLPGSSIPSPPWWLPETLRGWTDCMVHGVLFFVQTLLLLGAGAFSRRRGWRWVAAALSSSYAIALELLQILVPGRSFQIIDLVFAAIGIAGALVVNDWRASRSSARLGT